ncbi:hypothetical protein AB0L40_15010 [Patulibacter sp. NPDC049589]|uniref:hypothetical protein n=1 Tax=Patulibacter sp. NPDC049589 TaxID=3154731 RepID=UPI00342A2871
MRSAAVRPLLVVALSGLAALGAAAPAGAHGGTKIAEGGSGGVSILTQAEVTTTSAGEEAVDLSTTIEGAGTGKGATVTYWIRPSGGKTFKATTTRDDAGIAHTDVPTAGRGAWRDWDISAILDLSTGKRLRVSNAEANPPGPDPASTPGGGATGADEGEPGTTTDDTPASGGTAPDTATGTTPATTTDETGTTTGSDAATNDDDATASPIEDVSGDDGGTPDWVVPSAVVVIAAALALVLVQRRRRGPLGGDED